eukprot:TRINITY_DN1820_c0_g4_i1.p1 TRINITY_DN1820_c0_g4~~TRINITY_DN1820_c0_g4_i1.p1  ORF type:complete len:357 (+),score=55.99 TRINITY_DN1820_c0_g4_i1:72-1142(+)
MTTTIEKDTKKLGWELWEKIGRPKYVVAPMVDQSELAWRILSKRYGAQLCYTPMLHSQQFVLSQKYRKENFTTCSFDRPLFAQFCGNDPQTLLSAAKLIQHECDAVDLNLGCPQHIARRGHYGSYLQDEWELLERIVSTMSAGLDVPVTCKIRIFPTKEKTIQYAQMLERAGCSILTVHGRIREQRGTVAGLADWNMIKAVKESVSIPVIANGNILRFEDIEKCLAATGAEAVMSAEGNLFNPALFSGLQPHCWKMAEEYLELCRQYETPTSFVRPHIFKIFRPALVVHTDIRDRLGVCKDFDEFVKLSNELKARLIEDETQNRNFGTEAEPHWVCQPYIRPPDPSQKRPAREDEA